eukprot:GHVS01105440.1.p1 GENE.GHVS01105440.1~~GHVS01105440.1.p1  ORF type:complete len:383 (-),score=124.58 GHVS01105440.1:801-1949(-)
MSPPPPPPPPPHRTITIPIGAFNSPSSLSSPLPFPPPPPPPLSAFLPSPPRATPANKGGGGATTASTAMASTTTTTTPCLEPSILGPVTLWVCFASSLLTILLALVVIFASGASIHWPTPFAITSTANHYQSGGGGGLPSSFPSSSSSSAFLSDVNQMYWRSRLFSFTPSVLIDKFTPLLMGILSLLLHTHPFSSAVVRSVTLSFTRLFAWTLCVALWGNLGYAGGLGIVIGTLTLLASVLCFISMWVCDGPASLNLFRHSNNNNSHCSPSSSSSSLRRNCSNGTPSSNNSTATTSTSAGGGGTTLSRKNYDLHAISSNTTLTTAEGEAAEGGGGGKGGSASGRLVEVGRRGPDGSGCAYSVIVPVQYNQLGGTPMEYHLNI